MFLLLIPSPLASLRVQSLALFSSVYILRLSLIFFNLLSPPPLPPPPPVSYHLYADDTQLYISFSSSDSLSHLFILSSALDSVFDWFISNRLSVNPSKTEFFLLALLNSVQS